MYGIRAPIHHNAPYHARYISCTVIQHDSHSSSIEHKCTYATAASHASCHVSWLKIASRRNKK